MALSDVSEMQFLKIQLKSSKHRFRFRLIQNIFSKRKKEKDENHQVIYRFNVQFTKNKKITHFNGFIVLLLTSHSEPSTFSDFGRKLHVDVLLSLLT